MTRRNGVSDKVAADEGDVRARQRLAKAGVQRKYTDPDAVNKAALGTVAATAGGGPELALGKMALRGLSKVAAGLRFGKRAEQTAATAVKRRGIPRGTLPKNSTKGVPQAQQVANARAKDAQVRALVKEHGGGHGVGTHVAKALKVTPVRARALIKRATKKSDK